MNENKIDFLARIQQNHILNGDFNSELGNCSSQYFDIRNASLILISIGMFYLFYVLSLRFIACIFLLPFIYFIIKEAKPLNKEHDEFKKENKNVLIKILKYIKDHRTVSSVLVHYIVTIVILAIIPLLEFIFYRGNFKISCTIYLIVGSMLYIISRKK
jgi:hypothetical protein